MPPEAWQHMGEEDNAGNIIQNWVYYKEEHVEGGAKTIIRIDVGAKAEDSTAKKWVEIQKFYLALLAGRVIRHSPYVGTPFRDLLRARFPHLMLGAKEEVQAGIAHTSAQLKAWMNLGLPDLEDRGEDSEGEKTGYITSVDEHFCPSRYLFLPSAIRGPSRGSARVGGYNGHTN